MIVYISGPMTGYVDYNRAAFHAAEEHLRSQGWDVVNPAREDDLQDTTGMTHADYLRRDIRLLMDCDAIYLLPGWRYSKGANIEHDVALACGIQILVETNLDLWRTFEGDPIEQDGEPDTCGHTVGPVPKLDGEVLTCTREPHTEGDHEAANGAWWIAEDVSATECASEGAPEPGDEDLSDHPQWGDVGIVVDDTMPPNTLRIESAFGHIDYHVSWDEHHQMHLHPKRPETAYLLSTVEQPQPGDEFPNVGYVRRWRALRELRVAHNEGERRSA